MDFFEFIKQPFIFPIITVVLTAILTLLGVDYMKTKWVSKATLKDIGKITEKVDSVKNDLLFYTQNKTNFKSAEREALFDYNKRLATWIFYINGFRLKTYNKNNYNGLKEESVQLRKLHTDFNISHAHFSIFTVMDLEFNDKNKALIDLITSYSETLKNAMKDVFTINSEADYLGVWKESNNTENSIAKAELGNKILNNLKICIDTYEKDLAKSFSELEPLYSELKRNFKLRLIELTQ